MKRVILSFFIGIAAFGVHVVAGQPTPPPQAFTAVFWTKTTLHSPAGKPATFMRRTVYTRDAFGKVQCLVYRPTKGLEHDTTAPLERVLTGSNSAQALPHVQSGREALEQEANLGSSQIAGLPVTGRRQTFRNSEGELARTLETWFSPDLGLTVHIESQNARGDAVSGEISEVHYGSPDPSLVVTAPAAPPAIPLLHLYRGLFTLVAHMERDRLENDPNRHVNMNEIEDHLRTKMSLSASEWQGLVQKSVNVESYTREAAKQAHSFAVQDRAARHDNPLSANTLPAGRATLHKMQTNLNTHIQGDIDNLTAAIGPEATGRIETYLNGAFSSSVSRTQISPTRLQAMRARGGQSQ